LTSAASEDKIKNSYLGKPVHEHPHIAPTRNLHGFWANFKAGFSIFDDQEHYIYQSAKYAAKGAFLGVTVGLSLGLFLKNFQNLAIRKIAYYVNENLFATATYPSIDSLTS
jgi:hypothetical protein